MKNVNNAISNYELKKLPFFSNFWQYMAVKQLKNNDIKNKSCFYKNIVRVNSYTKTKK